MNTMKLLNLQIEVVIQEKETIKNDHQIKSQIVDESIEVWYV